MQIRVEDKIVFGLESIKIVYFLMINFFGILIRCSDFHSYQETCKSFYFLGLIV